MFDKFKKRREENRALIISQYQSVFSGPNGMAVLADLAKSSFFEKTTFVPGDPNASAFNEGQRQNFLGIVRILGIDHAKIVEEIKRQREREMEE